MEASAEAGGVPARLRQRRFILLDRFVSFPLSMRPFHFRIFVNLLHQSSLLFELAWHNHVFFLLTETKSTESH